MTFWTYMLRCADESFYTGHTDALEPRVVAHQRGEGADHIRRRRPVIRVWCQDFPFRLEALEAERRIKGWSRAKKQALIKGDFAEISRLARSRPSTSSGRTE